MSLIHTIAHDHGIRELKLMRPPVNALNPPLCEALENAVRQAGADDVRGLILSGGEGVFSAGLDVPYLLSLGEDTQGVTAAWNAFFQAVRAIATAPFPVVAAMAGHAPAGGCVLALCCDYRIMAAGPFRIGLNETQVGLVAPEGIQHLLRRVVGVHRAERLLVAGHMPDAAQAQAIGLVDEVVESAQVLPRALAWLSELLRLPRQPMLDTRAIARADLVAALQPERIELARFIDAWRHPDTQAGLRALVAKLGKPAA